MVEIRKTITLPETAFSELGVEEARPITRAVGVAVIQNPFAGQFVDDLRPLFEAGAMVGEQLMPELVKLLDGPAVSHGKGAIVGVAGEMEHGAACIHPMLGKPMRAAIGGGKAVIGSNVKVADCGRFARRAARTQGRFLVLPAFRQDHGLGGGCTSTR
jgi:amino acid synthesis protein